MRAEELEGLTAAMSKLRTWFGLEEALYHEASGRDPAARSGWPAHHPRVA
jgi:hypothetical protein